MKDKDIKKVVRESYAKKATGESSCCAPADSCCGTAATAENISRAIGYGSEELKSAPEGANLGLGCGNPVAIASLKEGETVLDLGSGAGIDCFLAANKVGKKGKVIGIDMTPEMIDKAKENAKKGDYQNVEFKLGEIENLPVPDNTVDVLLSNCVINLSPDKRKVFKEAFRVLKSGGRVMISDIVLLNELPDLLKESVYAYVGCISGAMLKEEYLSAIKDAGFQQIEILGETGFPTDHLLSDPVMRNTIENLNIPEEMVRDAAGSVVSVKVTGQKR